MLTYRLIAGGAFDPRQSYALSTSHVHACQQTTCCKSSCTITSKINKGQITIIHVSCAQRTCGNASAPQKITQATAEAGDARHTERTAPPNVPPNMPERFVHMRRAVHHTASACRTSICCINLPAQTSRCGRVAWLSKSRRAPFHLVVMDNGCLRWTKNLEIECH